MPRNQYIRRQLDAYEYAEYIYSRNEDTFAVYISQAPN